MSEKYRVTFFQPGQIVFHVAGNADIDSLIEWAVTEAKKEFPEVQISKSNQDPLPFPGSAVDSRGIYFQSIYKAASPSKIAAQSRPFIPPPYEKRGPFTLVPATVAGFNKEEEMDKLLDLVLFLDEKRKEAPGNALQVVSPNWLMNGDRSDPGGTGGPGGRPIECHEDPNTQEHHFHFDSFKTDIQYLFEYGQQGDGVVVAVLDTIPVLDTVPKDQILDEIYRTWVTNVTEDTRKHSLLQSMLDDSNRRLFLEFDNEVDRSSSEYQPDPPGYLQVDDHDYLMSDHGLFEAGLIHSLAPKAEIHLFQVLNRYGVGDLMGIARGLKKVIARFPNRNLLVNMSLTMQFPLEEAHIDTDDAKGRELGMKILDQRRPRFVDFVCMLINWFCKVIYDRFHIQLPGCEESWFERQASSLLSICQSVSILGSDIIAAAGNKRKGLGRHRPQAEFPAAFPEVLGVGALPKYARPRIFLETTSYSNYSDRPRGSGIATLGGEKDENGDTGRGILGIYLGDIPGSRDGIIPPTPSANGWAYWCGTSFATAIMTGMTANMLSNMPGNTPRNAIRNIFRSQFYWTKQFEDVLFVTQGSSHLSS